MNRQPASVESVLSRRKAQRQAVVPPESHEGIKGERYDSLKAPQRSRRTTFYPDPSVDARFRAARAHFLVERGEDLSLTAALNLGLELLLDDFEAHGQDSVLVRRLRPAPR